MRWLIKTVAASAGAVGVGMYCKGLDSIHEGAAVQPRAGGARHNQLRRRRPAQPRLDTADAPLLLQCLLQA